MSEKNVLGREDLLKTPIRMLDLSKSVSINDLVEGFSNTSFQARKLSQCVDIYRKMVNITGFVYSFNMKP